MSRELPQETLRSAASWPAAPASLRRTKPPAPGSRHPGSLSVLVFLAALVGGCTSVAGPEAAADGEANVAAVASTDGGADPSADRTPAAGAGAGEPALAADAGSQSPAARYLADPEAVALGRRYFQGTCTGYCHSTQPGVVKEAPNLFDCAWDHGGSDEDIFRVIAEGVPDTQMQAFGGKLPDEVLWKMVAFVRSRSRCE